MQRCGCFDTCYFCFENSFNFIPRWQNIANNIIETTEEGAIEQAWMIAGNNDYAVRTIVFDHL